MLAKIAVVKVARIQRVEAILYQLIIEVRQRSKGCRDRGGLTRLQPHMSAERPFISYLVSIMRSKNVDKARWFIRRVAIKVVVGNRIKGNARPVGKHKLYHSAPFS